MNSSILSSSLFTLLSHSGYKLLYNKNIYDKIINNGLDFKKFNINKEIVNNNINNNNDNNNNINMKKIELNTLKDIHINIILEDESKLVDKSKLVVKSKADKSKAGKSKLSPSSLINKKYDTLSLLWRDFKNHNKPTYIDYSMIIHTAILNDELELSRRILDKFILDINNSNNILSTKQKLVILECEFHYLKHYLILKDMNKSKEIILFHYSLCKNDRDRYLFTTAISSVIYHFILLEPEVPLFIIKTLAELPYFKFTNDYMWEGILDRIINSLSASNRYNEVFDMLPLFKHYNIDTVPTLSTIITKLIQNESIDHIFLLFNKFPNIPGLHIYKKLYIKISALKIERLGLAPVDSYETESIIKLENEMLNLMKRQLETSEFKDKFNLMNKRPHYSIKVEEEIEANNENKSSTSFPVNETLHFAFLPFDHLLVSYLQKNCLDLAFDTFKRVVNTCSFLFSIRVCNTIITRATHDDRADIAEFVFDCLLNHIKKQNLDINGNVISHLAHSLIKYYSNNNSAKLGRVLTQLKEFGAELKMHTWFAIISGKLLNKEWKKGMAIIKYLEDIGCVVDENVYIKAINMLTRRSCWLKIVENDPNILSDDKELHFEIGNDVIYLYEPPLAGEKSIELLDMARTLLKSINAMQYSSSQSLITDNEVRLTVTLLPLKDKYVITELVDEVADSDAELLKELIADTDKIKLESADRTN